MRHPIWPALLFPLLLSLAACTSTPAPPSPEAMPWHDQRFEHQAHAVELDEAALFRLDPALQQRLRDGDVAGPQRGGRNALLLELVFGPDMKAFAYAGGHSTVAADTWRQQRGDCLSLSIMTLALARALGLNVHVQEVRVPPSFDRRGGVDFLNAHVNVLMPNDQRLRAMQRWLPPGDIVIDFEPQAGTRQRGVRLSDKALLARFLNNRAAEHLAAGEDGPAYAHFRAAILTDPAYAAAYNNLAQLYLRHGLDTDAEALLRRALVLNPDADLALVSLHRLLLAQARHSEAQDLAGRLQARRERDPYYWLGRGIDELQQGRNPQAVRALEQAQALTSGFDEVHRHLAIAYGRTCQLKKAREQLAVVRSSKFSSGDLESVAAKLRCVP